jgi:hypothetical protein
MSGMRRNPRHNGSERAGSRPHETNLLTCFNECVDVFFLFPGRVWIVFYLLQGTEQTKNPTWQKSFVCFGTLRGDTGFRFRVSILFLTVFQK